MDYAESDFSDFDENSPLPESDAPSSVSVSFTDLEEQVYDDMMEEVEEVEEDEEEEEELPDQLDEQQLYGDESDTDLDSESVSSIDGGQSIREITIPDSEEDQQEEDDAEEEEDEDEGHEIYDDGQTNHWFGDPVGPAIEGEPTHQGFISRWTDSSDWEDGMSPDDDELEEDEALEVDDDDQRDHWLGDPAGPAIEEEPTQQSSVTSDSDVDHSSIPSWTDSPDEEDDMPQDEDAGYARLGDDLVNDIGLPFSPLGRLIALGQQFHRFQSEVDGLTESVRELRQLHQGNTWTGTYGTTGNGESSDVEPTSREDRAFPPRDPRNNSRQEAGPSSSQPPPAAGALHTSFAHQLNNRRRGAQGDARTGASSTRQNTNTHQTRPNIFANPPSLSFPPSPPRLETRELPRSRFSSFANAPRAQFSFATQDSFSTASSTSQRAGFSWASADMDDELHEIVVQRPRDSAVAENAASSASAAAAGSHSGPQQRRADNQPAFIDLTFSSDDEDRGAFESFSIRSGNPHFPAPQPASSMAPPPANRNRRRQPQIRRTPSLARSDGSILGTSQVIDLTLDADEPSLAQQQQQQQQGRGQTEARNPGLNRIHTRAQNRAQQLRQGRSGDPSPFSPAFIDLDDEEAEEEDVLPGGAFLDIFRNLGGVTDHRLFIGGGIGLLHRLGGQVFGQQPAEVDVQIIGQNIRMDNRHANPLANNAPNFNYGANGFNNPGAANNKAPYVPPPPPEPGFTRCTGEDQDVICAGCEEALAYDPDEKPPPPTKKARTKKDQEEHHFWAVKECGHVGTPLLPETILCSALTLIFAGILPQLLREPHEGR